MTTNNTTLAIRWLDDIWNRRRDATIKAIEMVGSTWFRFRNGKIAEGHDTWNQGALLASLSK